VERKKGIRAGRDGKGTRKLRRLRHERTFERRINLCSSMSVGKGWRGAIMVGNGNEHSDEEMRRKSTLYLKSHYLTRKRVQFPKL